MASTCSKARASTTSATLVRGRGRGLHLDGALRSAVLLRDRLLALALPLLQEREPGRGPVRARRATTVYRPASVGVSIPKLEGNDKVTGRAQYVDDLRIPGLLYGRTVR